jgi:PBP1b-binding outer membrane lipoprotein LpoB
MGKTNASLVLVIIIVTTFSNGCTAEGAGKGNQQKKNDGIYKPQKLETCDCLILHTLSSLNPFIWKTYYEDCISNHGTSKFFYMPICNCI